MPSSRGAKRSSEVIDVDVDGDGGGKPVAIRSSFKKPKNHVQSTLVTTNPGNEGVVTMDVRLADFILSNGLPPSLVECPKLKLDADIDVHEKDGAAESESDDDDGDEEE